MVKYKTEIAISLDKIIVALNNNNIMIAAAESCTGGWIAKLLTDRAGSTAWFERGFVTYSNLSKAEMLGVSKETLSQHGAVSEVCVREMAEGALQRGGATLSLAVSGIAGPGGGSEEKPVGLVWFGWSMLSGGEVITTAAQHIFSGDRGEVRAQSVIVALDGACGRITSSKNGR
ncbi:MAG: nicotinamide-nucleotide amidohydrolase family protein [Thiotrichales bacterium]|jgi:nicotinamide-nucleotide amidase|nr:nicotinamide-nucleotide amidohydrolase family protein [Thiotrichales bacterium]MBT3613338.1 nicotinamide-nucleotide amidohydrolase family protein [Thiotrichales bacterium]MBT3753377.1 nicotinamide-nucleotide amidohydrolase family protein [Thiotrichales bacterium]MBT3837512.1 nicotinamide-nucleotide amidohydrolase family protein [Thiotrichales bacterium]MBT4152360.1 nicotinamide-nucleotide amidohydrolase family protein [Thiotrichales bacterium]